jgi:hypothetical protein
MAGVFARTNEVNNHPKRNTFPLSFQNNLSGKFGVLYPCLVQDVVPGFTFKSKPTFALEFMPTAFPVQTRMRARMHFFYVRNRNLWKDFPDFYGKTKEGLVSPYVLFQPGDSFNSMARTGSLGDYLGMPTTFTGSFGDMGYRYTAQEGVSRFDFIDLDVTYDDSVLFNGVHEDSILPDFGVVDFSAKPSTRLGFLSYGHISGSNLDNDSHDIVVRFDRQYDSSQFTSGTARQLLVAFSAQDKQLAPCIQLSGRIRNERVRFYYYPNSMDTGGTEFLFPGITSTVLDEFLEGVVQDTLSIESLQFSLTFKFKQSLRQLKAGVTYDEGLHTFYLDRIDFGYLCTPELFITPFDMFRYDGEGTGFFLDANSGIPVTSPLVDSALWRPIVAPVSVSGEGSSFGTVDVTFEQIPWTKLGTSGINVSALPFRAYESIYNAFYRDQRNNPFMVDGVPEYNKWIPSQEGGADYNVYSLRYANWEQDFLTTAVQSPQQGVAPLVGIVNQGAQASLAFQDAETGETYRAEFELESDGTVKSFKANTSDMPISQYRSLIDLATSGISINDFRNVNALQRWLETNMRKGYRLKDIIKGHYDVDVRFDELDMPEFIGGVTQDVLPTMVTQTTDGGDGSPLGSYAGQLSCVGTSKHSIRHYCDEPGWIIGILSVVPVPNYSQLLPKYFMRDNVLDYFFPEFGHIGYQPITYKEVCPIQAKAAGKDLSTVFGYQRAWYEYISRVDEVHGQMRTSLRDFLVNRVFDVAPQLSESFLLVDPSQTNQIFTVTAENEDVWMGQVYFDYQAKEPIPLYGIPKLE